MITHTNITVNCCLDSLQFLFFFYCYYYLYYLSSNSIKLVLELRLPYDSHKSKQRVLPSAFPLNICPYNNLSLYTLFKSPHQYCYSRKAHNLVTGKTLSIEQTSLPSKCHTQFSEREVFLTDC